MSCVRCCGWRGIIFGVSTLEGVKEDLEEWAGDLVMTVVLFGVLERW